MQVPWGFGWSRHFNSIRSKIADPFTHNEQQVRGWAEGSGTKVTHFGLRANEKKFSLLSKLV
jgi:hypothetical protein